MDIVSEIRQELRELSKNSENVRDYSRFHKDNKKHIRLATPTVRKLSAEKFKKVRHLHKEKIFELCEKLLACKNSACQDIAFDWAFRAKKLYAKEDFVVLEKWLDKYVDTWGSCDDLCTHALGYFLFVFPGFIPKIHTWTKSKNKWKRRASAVIFVYSARKGMYINDVLKIAKLLLIDKEDLVQKAYGWMLKEASRKRQKEIFDFVIEHKNIMSRTALRYAIEKMPANIKKQAMQKNK